MQEVLRKKMTLSKLLNILQLQQINIFNDKDEVKSYFAKGKRCSPDKMNPAQIIELLKSTHPKRFHIPSETKIKQEISKLSQGSKKSNFDDDYVAKYVEFDTIVQEDSTTK